MDKKQNMIFWIIGIVIAVLLIANNNLFSASVVSDGICPISDGTECTVCEDLKEVHLNFGVGDCSYDLYNSCINNILVNHPDEFRFSSETETCQEEQICESSEPANLDGWELLLNSNEIYKVCNRQSEASSEIIVCVESFQGGTIVNPTITILPSINLPIGPTCSEAIAALDDDDPNTQPNLQFKETNELGVDIYYSTDSINTLQFCSKDDKFIIGLDTELEQQYFDNFYDCGDQVMCPSIIGWKVVADECVSDSGCNYNNNLYTYYATEQACENTLIEDEVPQQESTCYVKSTTGCASVTLEETECPEDYFATLALCEEANSCPDWVHGFPEYINMESDCNTGMVIIGLLIGAVILIFVLFKIIK